METSARARSTASTRDRRFYLSMAIASAAGIFLGFARTFYLKTYFATPALPLVLHFAWRGVHVLDSLFRGASRADRGWPRSGSPALGLCRRVSRRRRGHFGHHRRLLDGKGRPFSLHRLCPRPGERLHVCAGGYAAVRCIYRRRIFFRLNREVHQRTMLMATVCALLPSALGRFAFTIHPALPVILIYTFVLAGPVYDLVTRRRVHRAYVLGLLFFLLLSPPVRIFFGMTPAWHRIVHWLSDRRSRSPLPACDVSVHERAGSFW